jgi:HPt (histidine-containing phosphotransfer) domain-containing protein
MVHIDEKSALALLGNSEKLYVKLVTSFYGKYKDIEGDFEELVDQNDYEEARRLAHSIKGLCGNLGAHELQEISKELEYAFKDQLMTYSKIGWTFRR